MALSRRSRRRILGITALVSGGVLTAGLLASAGLAADSSPSMEVLPTTTGLHYKQTVEVKGHHLPKGSGSVAATICGLTDASGHAIASPTADDCAGAESIGKLVVLKQWQSDGEFDAQYTLPASKQEFGKNKRFCDATHNCALVVADANPDNPAYYLATPIYFDDQTPPGGGGTTPTTTGSNGGSDNNNTTTTAAPAGGSDNGGTASGSGEVKVNGTADGSASSSGAHVHIGGSWSVTPPSGGAPSIPTTPPTLPPQAAAALQQVCSQLSSAVTQAGGDASALNAACSAIASGGGPAQLQAVLANPSLLCVAGASAWQNNAQVTDACNQVAGALAPLTGPLGGLGS